MVTSHLRNIISGVLLIFFTFIFKNIGIYAQENYEQAYGYAFKDSGTFNKIIRLTDGVNGSFVAVGQYNGYGVIAKLGNNGETLQWQRYDTLLASKGSVFTDIHYDIPNSRILVSGICKACETGRTGQSAVIFRIDTTLKPININAKPFTFLSPVNTALEVRTIVKIHPFLTDLYVAYEGDSGFGSDIYLSKHDVTNFTKVWEKQYNYNFFELPVMLSNENLNTLALGLHGWGKTRLLKINTADGSVTKQYGYSDIPGRFVSLGGGRYALAYYENKQMRISTINQSGIEKDSVFIPTNFDFTQQFSIDYFGRLYVSVPLLAADELPYIHSKTRIYNFDTANLKNSRFIEIPENGTLFRNIKQVLPYTSGGDFFTIVGDRPEGKGRPFFFNRSNFTTAPKTPVSWYATAPCSDATLFEKTNSKTFPHTLPYIYNNVKYAAKNNYLNKSENLWLDIYQPYDYYAKKSGELRPVLIFFSGGGYANMSEDGATNFMLQAAQRGLIGVSVKYRTGIHPNYTGNVDSTAFYAEFYLKSAYRALQDARDAVRYVFNNAAQYGIDKNKIFIAGHSAGGNIVLNYNYLSQNNFPSNIVTELGALTAKTPVTGIIPYAAPFSTVAINPPVDPLSYMDPAEKEPLYLIHGTCDPLAYFDKGNPVTPNSIYTTGAFPIACKQQELNHPYHLSTIKGGGHEMGDAEPLIFESFFKWIKSNNLCGTPDKACETFSVVNTQACANVTACPSCKSTPITELSNFKSEIFPNPVASKLRITVSTDNPSSQCEAFIFNTLGQSLLYTILDKNTEGGYSKTIDVSALHNGSYILVIKTDDAYISKKLFQKTSN
jgi:acetyl esterase/lipase